ncbi:branched-chain amino acid ABC transporter permease LivH [Labrys sp. LIt4]|uniref:Branched-chain amino acid ABC transporter permease LivH n=1 Tax=Labrys okinawensis TaxID=346911 RepID=A0A2S9QAY8_9HYPH|nr:MULTISPECIES: branched-chain amino acid ABC transporter permease LivH [Labrys]MBP0578781.1 branched-chain amino acid ABC transporter permease LivH [Labrys sp. LIt4]PRH86509.1 branched-chain amino acid ABC transporter permease LivH [Labrys okinawensis]
MAEFLQQLINGLAVGSLYGLIAVGYTMVFGIIGMVNFAHGDLFMLSAIIAFICFVILVTLLGLSSVIVALLAVMAIGMVLTSIWNWAIERIAYRPLRGSFRLAPLISAIGVSMALSNFVQVSQGAESKAIPHAVDAALSAKYQIWSEVASDGRAMDASLSLKAILIFVTTAVLLAVFWYIVSRTSLGRAQRACEQDRKMAALLGVDVDRTISITFIMGAALAAVAGLMFLVLYGSVNFRDGFVPGVKAFTAAVLGGIGSLPGAVLGGMLIGLIEKLWEGSFEGDVAAYRDVAVFSVLAITLIFMPQGLLGRPEVEKV